MWLQRRRSRKWIAERKVAGGRMLHRRKIAGDSEEGAVTACRSMTVIACITPFNVRWDCIKSFSLYKSMMSTVVHSIH